MVRQILKPRTSGITHLLVPKPNEPDEWDSVNDRATMEMLLLQHSQQHFKQADGTPYTKDPLWNLLKPDGLTPFGQQIYEGVAPDPALTISTGARLLLTHQCNKLPTL